jgi:UDP-4-amino-4-deoxy-L-arabinose formyltransferase/UDP-glucuronic acid dehydrogenase (UDP-4-keto-hexauronic acid decarboxylating)
MNFVLIGDDFPAAQTLKLLLEYPNIQVAMVFSSPQPERSAKVKALAEQNQIPFYNSDLIKKQDGLSLLSIHQFDWLINTNSTVLIPSAILELPRAGALNMHPGLLPGYAGLHTHQWALRNGEQTFGSTIHFIEPRVDVGDIVLQRQFPIKKTDTGLSLFYNCIREGILGMRTVIEDILAEKPLARQKQDLSKYHLYRHRDALDGRIDWRWSADEVERFVRAGNYAPFHSPTYTAHLDLLVIDGQTYEVEVLNVTPVVVPITAVPGKIFAELNKPPMVTCKVGAVRLDQCRLRGQGGTLSPDELNRLLPDGIILKGRESN